MPDPRELTDLQLAILSILWARREATVAEVHEALGDRLGASRKTLATLLDRLERRGFVRHGARGRENVYRAAVTRRRVVLARVSSVLGALFEPGDGLAAAGAAPRAVDGGEVRDGDVDRVLALLRRAERDLRDAE